MLSFRKSVLTVLVLGLVALPTFAAPTGESTPPPAGFEKYLPDDAASIIKINVRQFLDSELVKKAGLDKALANDDAKKMMTELGFDPIKDVECIIFTNIKDKPEDGDIIIQGKFDPAKLAAATEAHAKENGDNLKVHKAANGKIYEVTKLDELLKNLPAQAQAVGAGLAGKSLYLVYPDKHHVVIAATKESAEDVLAKSAGKKTTKLASKELGTLIGKINPKQTVCVAYPSPAGADGVKSITGGITVTANVKVDVKVAASDADAAKKLNSDINDQLKQLQSIAALLALSEKELAPAVEILNAIKIDAKEDTVGITSDIKGDTIEKLVKAVKSFAEKNGLK